MHPRRKPPPNTRFVKSLCCTQRPPNRYTTPATIDTTSDFSMLYWVEQEPRNHAMLLSLFKKFLRDKNDLPVRLSTQRDQPHRKKNEERVQAFIHLGNIRRPVLRLPTAPSLHLPHSYGRHKHKTTIYFHRI